MAQFLKFLLLALLFSAAVMRASSQSSFRTRQVPIKATKKSVLSLFNAGLGSKFWTEKVLGHEYDDLTVSESSPSGKAALQNYTKAGTISHYLKLSLVDAIHLPLPINFIFIGFNGDGNQGLTLGEDELERWFSNIDHILEHTRIPQLGESLTPFYRLKGSLDHEHHLPLISATHYNYSVHGIELGSKVTEVFEHAIKVLSRRENFSDTSPDADVKWQVDMGGMTHLFSNLVEYLQLDNAYNIFVVNPKRDPKRGSYGYRFGLSEAEIGLLKKSSDTRKQLLSSKEKILEILEVEKLKNPLYERHPLLRFAWTSADNDDTATWANTWHNALDAFEQSLLGKEEGEIVLWRAKQILAGKDIELASVLRRGLKGDDDDIGLQHECLVDTWVGKDRWAFVDLSAGPFSWGPAVGGDGVRTELTLPSVDASFGSLPVTSTNDDDSVHEEFQELWRDRFTYLGEDEQHAVDMLLAEIDVYEVFADRHCRGRKVALTFCEELLERINDVQDELQAIKNQAAEETETNEKNNEHRAKATDALRRIEEWNIFGFVNEHTKNFSTARDLFLAHLGSVLASSMRHVVTPSTADGAFHFYENVYFQIYFISQDRYKHDALLPVDIIGLKTALSQLIVPAQKAFFGVQKLALSEDPALAMAFAAAKRAAVVPMLSVNGTYKASQRVYLDSLILQHHIKRLEKLRENKLGRRSNSIEVPIFWFLRSGTEPLLVDKHYQAKALSDMVIVVQSTKRVWESHLQCNGQSIMWDLTEPYKAAIAAVAEHMAGLIPSELTFSQAHENAMQDWTWSVGSHPFSSTSGGWHVSGFQNDAMARSYIVTAFDESINIVNAAVEILANERTQALTFPAFRAHEQSLRYSYNAVVNLWKRIAAYSEDLRYAEALKLLNHLELSAQLFMTKVNDTKTALHPVYCTRQRKPETRVDIATGFAIITILIVLWLVLRPRRVKPKIN